MSQKRLPRAPSTAASAPPVGSAPPDLSRLSFAAAGGLLSAERREENREKNRRVTIADEKAELEAHQQPDDNEKDDQEPPKPLEEQIEPYKHVEPERSRWDWLPPKGTRERTGNERARDRESDWQANHLACHFAYGTSAEERFAQTVGFLTKLYTNEGYMCNCNYDPVGVVPNGYTKNDVYAAGFFTERHYNEFMLQQLFCHTGRTTGTYAAPSGSVTKLVQEKLAKVDLFKKDYEAILRRTESSAELGLFDEIRLGQMLGAGKASLIAAAFFGPLGGAFAAILLAVLWSIFALQEGGGDAENNSKRRYEKEKKESADSTRIQMAALFDDLAKDREKLRIANALWVAHKTRVHAAIFSISADGLFEGLFGHKKFDHIVILRPAGYEDDHPYVFEPGQELLPDVPGGVGPATPTSLQPEVNQMEKTKSEAEEEQGNMPVDLRDNLRDRGR